MGEFAAPDFKVRGFGAGRDAAISADKVIAGRKCDKVTPSIEF
jgi:hypothetical protein